MFDFKVMLLGHHLALYFLYVVWLMYMFLLNAHMCIHIRRLFAVASIVDAGRSIIGFAIFDLKLVATDAQFRCGDAGVCSYFGLM